MCFHTSQMASKFPDRTLFPNSTLPHALNCHWLHYCSSAKYTYAYGNVHFHSRGTACPALGSSASLDANQQCSCQAYRHQYKLRCMHICHNTFHQRRWVWKLIILSDVASIIISHKSNQWCNNIYTNLHAFISHLARNGVDSKMKGQSP